MRLSRLAPLVPSVLALLCGCAGTTALYPPRPPAVPGLPIADPQPARVVVHARVSGEALQRALDLKLPVDGEGTFPLFGGERRYSWRRQPLRVRFGEGKITVELAAQAVVELLGTRSELPLEIEVQAEPVVSADYRARLQAVRVQVRSSDTRLRIAQGLGGALDKIREQLERLVREFRYDLRPLLAEAHGRLGKPLDLELGEAHGCAQLKVLGVEAGPTVLADGLEKDLALVVAPSVTLPCAAEPATTLPQLQNVATLQPGPFTLEIPIAARYEELAGTMALAFTDGKLYFSKEFPSLYLERPEVYASRDQLVVKLHLGGRVDRRGLHTALDGDLFMSGHPAVIDNELRVPDLEPTIETSSFLLKLATALDGGAIREQARAALRLDLGQRLQSVRDKLSSELSFSEGQGCLQATADRVVVTGVHPHGSYLRLYVSLTGRAAVHLPCPITAPVEAAAPTQP